MITFAFQKEDSDTHMPILHITNGDATVDLLKVAGIKGEYLPWRDILHMGAVPTNLFIKELSWVRAEYISSLGWADCTSVDKDFKARDSILDDAFNFGQTQ